jgi:hypothetical protein
MMASPWACSVASIAGAGSKPNTISDRPARLSCGGRRHVLADILEREAIDAILTHLGLPTEPPPIARGRSPDFEPD